MAGDTARAYRSGDMKHTSQHSLRSAGIACAALILSAATASANAQPNSTTDPTSPTYPNTTTPMPSDSSRYDSNPDTQSNRDVNSSLNRNNRASEKFVSKASMLGSEELRLSQVAAQRATNPQVRSFAQKLIDAHQKMDEELNRIAQTKGITIPTGKNAEDRGDEVQKWQKKDSDDFDEDYVSRMIKLHKDTADELQDCIDDNNADPELSSFAQKYLPDVRQHLEEAKSLKKQVD